MRHNILMPIMIFMTRFYHSFSLFFRFNSASNKLIRILRPALVVMAVFFVISCEESPTKIGSDLLPSNDFVVINSTDTLSVWSYTMYNNSVATNSPSGAFVGSIFDAYFGTTTAEFVSQLRISNAWHYGPVTIDSVKMILQVTVKGGTAGADQFLKLSEISDQIYTDSVYYSDTQTNTTGFETTVQLPALKADTTNNISVSLPVEFGEYLTRDTTQFFYSNTKPDFRSYFKGIYFQLMPSTDPVMLGFSLVNKVASGGSYTNYFVLFMHDTVDYRYRYYFILDPKHPNAAYNKISRDFSAADPDKRIQHINDNTYRDTLSYIQYLNGVYTKIVFPGLDSLKMKFAGHKVSVNKARIGIPVFYDGDRFTYLTVPSSLRLRYIDQDSSLKYGVPMKYDVPDFDLDINNKFFDGTLHKADSTYYFNIPTFIQKYLEDNHDKYLPELELYQATGLRSVVLRANESKTPVKFEMTYTKY
jgi:hypothetical protein